MYKRDAVLNIMESDKGGPFEKKKLRGNKTETIIKEVTVKVVN